MYFTAVGMARIILVYAYGYPAMFTHLNSTRLKYLLSCVVEESRALFQSSANPNADISAIKTTPFFIPSTSFCSLSSWFASSWAYHLITVPGLRSHHLSLTRPFTPDLNPSIP